MKKWWSLLGLLLLAMIFSGQTARQEQRPLFVPGEVVVKVSDPGVMAAMPSSKPLGPGDIFVVRDTTGKEVNALVEELQSRPGVVYAEPNYLYYASEIPNDPQFGQLWGLHNTGQNGGTADADIDAVEAWEVQKGSAEVLVAVIDTGVDYRHPDLSANMWTNPGEDPWADPNDPRSGNGIDDDNNGYIDDWRGWDFVNRDNDPFDDNLHGTHVAGTIGAVGNNGAGVVGVNWNVRIMPLKFLGSGGSGSLSDAVEAITYAARFGAHVMNNSWGGGGRSQALEDAIKFANQQGALFVAAAGNDGKDNDVTPNYPSNYEVDNVLAVAAIDNKGNLAVFGSGGGGGGICGCVGNVLPTPGSNFGRNSVDLAAPGKEILSTAPNNSYQSLSGTSMATPHVSGIAALVLAQFPGLTNLQLKQHLMNSVDVQTSLQGKMVTGGILNAFKAVSTTPAMTP
ncbi:MAG: S8 family serine peptidase [candidate division KSB1 bacterium]|nr:S8 family serine peptidase [candidate division KSB1 bacterium]MDZ7275331.1 S8 family serine peptidase [candidate division KSB1 bacterium]MDZ7287498.1 S8 family serine peptidase [candidate division KSB1 bacterium]MDZ7299612.1 S8 family serine peptidase [candidate division KSB1 bacterium]MDZ7307405.1 S8 family serine peptidase [candidate division KSB1 bacterium]